MSDNNIYIVLTKTNAETFTAFSKDWIHDRVESYKKFQYLTLRDDVQPGQWKWYSDPDIILFPLDNTKDYELIARELSNIIITASKRNVALDRFYFINDLDIPSEFIPKEMKTVKYSKFFRFIDTIIDTLQNKYEILRRNSNR
jgi:hypothetical protein